MARAPFVQAVLLYPGFKTRSNEPEVAAPSTQQLPLRCPEVDAARHRKGMDFVAVPATSLLPLAVDEIEQVVYPHGKLEVLAIERTLVVVEPEPEKGLKRFGEEVDPSRVCLSGNALQDEKAIFFLDQPFRPGFPDGQECAQHIPAVGSGRQAKIGD